MIRIEVYRKRKCGVQYIEDIYTQPEIGAMTPQDILEYAKSNNKIRCCYSKILNVIGKYIRTEEFNVEDFYVYLVADEKTLIYKSNGQIKDWPHGYLE